MFLLVVLFRFNWRRFMMFEHFQPSTWIYSIRSIFIWIIYRHWFLFDILSIFCVYIHTETCKQIEFRSSPTDGCVRYGIDQVGQAGDMSILLGWRWEIRTMSLCSHYHKGTNMTWCQEENRIELFFSHHLVVDDCFSHWFTARLKWWFYGSSVHSVSTMLCTTPFIHMLWYACLGPWWNSYIPSID